jgi:hypothetical protein
MNNPETSLKEIVEEAYKSTLKPFHGWISSAAYRVSLPLFLIIISRQLQIDLRYYKGIKPEDCLRDKYSSSIANVD